MSEEIEHEEDQNPTEEETGFDDAFSDATGKQEDDTGEDEDADEGSEEEAEVKEADKDLETKPKAEDKAGKKKTAPQDAEEDKRGKEILAQEGEAKKKTDAEAAETQKKVDDQKKVEDEGKVKPFTADDVKTFSKIISDTELPDTVEIADGVEVNVKEFTEDFPAIKPLVAMIAQRYIESLISKGYLVAGNVFNQEASGLKDAVGALNFNNAVYRLAPEVEVKDEKGRVIGKEKMDVETVTDSVPFKKWLGTAPDTTKALFRGGPKDFALGLKKFNDSLKIVDAKKKVSDLDKKAKEKKDEHDDVHLHTVRKKSEGGEEDSGAEDDDFDGAFKEAAGKKKR